MNLCAIMIQIYFSNVLEKPLIVMENLFYKCNISNKFDLKGSTRNRFVDNTNFNGKPSEIVFWDENFIQSNLNAFKIDVFL